MGVRNVFPGSILFTIELPLSTVKRYRVTITLDLEERYVFLSSGVLPDIIDHLEEFVSQLSTIASNQLATLKWDGTSDLTTDYQIVRVLPGYQVERLALQKPKATLVKFNIVIGNSSLIHLEELHHKTTIQL